MLVAISISPSVGDETGGVSASVAEAVRVIRESGLPNRTDSMFTTIEGECSEVRLWGYDIHTTTAGSALPAHLPR